VTDKAFIRFALGIFVISLATLTFEVALSYEYSYMFWFAVSFIVITVAMFGLGIGSVVGYFQIKKNPEKYSSLMYRSSLGLGIAIVLALLATSMISRSDAFSNNTSWTSFDPGYSLAVLTMLASAVVPFVFSGFILSLGLGYPKGGKRRISYIYFADLLGAGIGSFLITAFLPFTGIEKVILVCSLLSILAAPLFLEKTTLKLSFAVPFILILLLLLYPGSGFLMPEASGDKFLSKLKNNGARVLHTEWTAVSRVDVVEYADKSLMRFIENGEYPITVTRGQVGSPGNERDPRYLMFIDKPRNMLAIGSGGGVELTMALHAGVDEIVGVEINPFIIEYMMNDLHGYSNRVYYNPSVKVFIEDGRTLVHRIEESFDLIENGVLGSSGMVVPSTSVLAFQDAYVYTVEANLDYWRKMSPRGVTVTIIYGLLDEYNSIDASRGSTYYLLRQYNTVKEALERVGVEAEKHVMMFRYEQEAGNLQASRAQAEYTFIFKEELGEDRVKALMEEGKKYGLEAVYAPYYEDSLDFKAMTENLAVNKDVSPVYDDRPFFYYTNRGAPMELYAFLGLLFIGTFFLITMPIVRQQSLRLDRNTVLLLIYFSCLGMGYILVEVTLIQKLVLFLGRPAYTFQVVLFTMLLFSGLGSFWTGYRVKAGITRKLAFILVLVVLGILGVKYALPQVIYGLMHYGIPIKILISIALIAPIAFMMGMPFPLGLRITSHLKAENVVWMFGLNASGSVIGSAMAMALAMGKGFSYVLSAGGALYLLAFAAVIALHRTVRI
jgi:hypothetical protein